MPFLTSFHVYCCKVPTVFIILDLLVKLPYIWYKTQEYTLEVKVTHRNEILKVASNPYLGCVGFLRKPVLFMLYPILSLKYTVHVIACLDICYFMFDILPILPAIAPVRSSMNAHIQLW